MYKFNSNITYFIDTVNNVVEYSTSRFRVASAVWRLGGVGCVPSMSLALLEYRETHE